MILLICHAWYGTVDRYIKLTVTYSIILAVNIFGIKEGIVQTDNTVNIIHQLYLYFLTFNLSYRKE